MDEQDQKLIKTDFENKEFALAYNKFKKEKSISEEEANWFLDESIKSFFKKGIDLALKKGANINNPKFFPIEQAILLKDVDLCKYLIKFGANLILDNNNIIKNIDEMLREQMNDCSQYLISLAAAESSPEILKLLIESGMDIRANDNHPLGWACSHGNVENTLFILDNFDVDINCMLISKETPLSWAINVENEKIVEILMKRGANLKAYNNYAINHAVKVDSIKVVEVILNYIKEDELILLTKILEDLINKNGLDEIKKSIQILIMKKTLEEELKTSINKRPSNKI